MAEGLGVEPEQLALTRPDKVGRLKEPLPFWRYTLFSLLREKGQTQTFRGQWFRNFIEAVGLILVFQILLYALFLGHLLKERELCFFISFGRKIMCVLSYIIK